MILQSLTDLYEALAAKEKVPRYGYAKGKVAFLMSIDEKGELMYITPLTEQITQGKTTKYIDQIREIPLPFVRSSGICPQFLCDSSAYLLGLANNGKEKRLKDCFDACKTFHNNVLQGCASPVARAVLQFFNHWSRDLNHQALTNCPEILNTGFIIIEVLNHGVAHEDVEIRKAWLHYLNSAQSQTMMPCLVTGQVSPIAQIHLKIKGVAGAQSSGANLVSFNAPCTESYGKESGLIAPVSEYGNFAYTTALNHLLSQSTSRCQIGEDTVVFWTKGDDEVATEAINCFLNPQNKHEEEEKLEGLMRSISKGLPIQDVDLSTPCFILGLSPNAARVSIRYFLRDTLGHFLSNITAHYKRLEIVKHKDAKKYLSPTALLRETANPNARTVTVSPLLGGTVMRAILSDTPYPDALFKATMLRIRALQDNADKGIYKITSGRAAILKACFLKMNLPQHDKEVLTVMLNKDSDNKAYVLGRLFSILEDIQQKANPETKSTIKDRFFNAASSSPLITFPNLLRLSQHHQKKITSEGMRINFQKDLGEVMDKLQVDNEPFPPRLSIKEQGLFILGYYHQTQYRYTKKEDR